MFSPPIAGRAPEPYVAVNADDAARLGLTAGGQADVSWPGVSRRLAVRVAPGLPAGVAGLPVGLPALAGARLPAWATIERSKV